MSTELHDAIWEHVPLDATPEHFTLRRAFMLAHVSADAVVVDLGCGAGEFSAALVQAGARPIGVDVAGEALRRARLLLPESDFRLWAAGEPLPVDDGAADIVWAGEVIEHVADVAPWLSEVRRVLRPGGVLVLTTPHHGPGTLLRLALSRRAFAAHFEPRSDHVRFYSPSTLGALLADFGFGVEEMRVRGGVVGWRSTILVVARRG
jgi:SAM-dependent methyltransferase